MEIPFPCALLPGLLAGFAWMPAAAAQCQITITSDPPLPAENLLKNPGFEDGDQPWLRQDAADEDGVTEEEKHSGASSYKLVGKKGASKSFRQGRGGGNQLDPPVSAGTEITIRAWSKAVGPDFEGGGYGLSAQVSYADGTSGYIPAPVFNKAPHGWVKATARHALAKDLRWIDWIHGGCYYDQTGTAYFDDLFVGIGKAKLSYRVECPALKRVKLYSEDFGLLHDSGPRADTGRFEHSLAVSLDDRFYVQVQDANGRTWGERYPKEDAPVFPPSKSGKINLFKRFPRETLKRSTEESYEVELPRMAAGKEVVLHLRARVDNPTVAGCAPALRLQINGQTVTIDHLLDRPNRFRFADGRDNPTAQGKDAFYVYYAPDCAGVADQDPYYPVDLPQNDPFSFRFDVGGLVKQGRNTVTIKNAHETAEKWGPLVVEDAVFLPVK